MGYLPRNLGVGADRTSILTTARGSFVCMLLLLDCSSKEAAIKRTCVLSFLIPCALYGPSRLLLPSLQLPVRMEDGPSSPTEDCAQEFSLSQESPTEPSNGFRDCSFKILSSDIS